MFTLDLETAPVEPTDRPYALEPFRLKQGKAKITELSISGPDDYSKLISDPTKDQINGILNFLKGKIVYCHNTVFDVAWMYAAIGDINPIINVDFRDTMLLGKWLFNSQSEQFLTKKQKKETGHGSLTLKALCQRVLDPDTPHLQEFLEMKSQAPAAGEDSEYWVRRAMFDTHFTLLLAHKLQGMLPEIQRRQFLIDCKTIPYIARAWVDGLPFDLDAAEELLPRIEEAKQSLAGSINIDPTVIQSPSQLSNLLFNVHGLTPLHVGKTGKGSTAAGDLKMLAIKCAGTKVGEILSTVQKFKKIQTLKTKYIDGILRTNSYIGESVAHGAPRMFSTVTGRMTYAGKTLRKKEYQVAPALHQLPRSGPAKSLFIPPEGKSILKFDASGQEFAFMGWASGDASMISILNNGINAHSNMATNLTGEDYDTFVNRYHSGDKDAYETRQAAKLLNLSCSYRIGAPSLKNKFFTDYDKIITDTKARIYLNIYKTSYPDVPKFWKRAPALAMDKGYAESIGRRRFYITDWSSHRWESESNSINHPVQGSGADQKYLIMYLLSEKFPELSFFLDIHDEACFFCDDGIAEELNKEAVHFLNNIDYDLYWQREVPMILKFEGNIGKNMKDSVEYEQSHESIVKMREVAGRRVL